MVITDIIMNIESGRHIWSLELLWWSFRSLGLLSFKPADNDTGDPNE